MNQGLQQATAESARLQNAGNSICGQVPTGPGPIMAQYCSRLSNTVEQLHAIHSNLCDILTRIYGAEVEQSQDACVRPPAEHCGALGEIENRLMQIDEVTLVIQEKMRRLESLA